MNELLTKGFFVNKNGVKSSDLEDRKLLIKSGKRK